MTYCKINKLSINHKKTNYMIINSPQRKCRKICILNLEQKHCVKYLGLFIDDHLNWKNQLKHINSKISKNLGILYKLRGYINLKILKHLYYTFVYPYLNYAATSWGNTYKSKLTKISTKQNRCIQCIFFVDSRENINLYYNILGVLKLENIIKLKTAIFASKFSDHDSNVPVAFSDFLNPVHLLHNYTTQDLHLNLNFCRPQVRTNYCKFTFKYTASVLWETIPYHMKHLPFKTFKRKYMLYLLSQQNDN